MFALIHVHYEYLKSQISTNHIHKQTFITKRITNRDDFKN